MSLLDPRSGAHLADGSPADHCWRLLVSGDAPGIGATIAGKLLARKRPQLIPVYDDVVRCALGQPSHFWISLHCALVDNPDLAVELAALRAHAPPYVSVIRVLDVVVWMAHEKEHKTRCHAERVSPPEIADDFTSVPDPRATRTEPTPHYGTGIAALDAVTGGGLKPR